MRDTDSPYRYRMLRSPHGLFLGALVIILVGLSIVLWAFARDAASLTTRSSADLGLFAVAGGLGGALRSVAYLLASASFSARQERQWRIETMIAPILGAVAGMAAYLVVLASIVQFGGVNPSGQYVVSLAVGALALAQFGRVAERGLLRSGTNRSGILGGEVSPSVPMLERIDSLLEQRVTDLTVVNYEGAVEVTARRIGRTQWLIDTQFASVDHPAYHRFRHRTDHDDDRAERLEGRTVREIVISGGVARDTVPFAISATSDRLHATPSLLSLTVPSEGVSISASLLVETADAGGDPGPDPDPIVVVVEIGQGSQVIQTAPVRLFR